MKFFRKTSVAVLLTLLVIALSLRHWLHPGRPQHPQDISDAPAQQAGESGLNYYLSWIDDDAGLFSMDTTDTLARSNLSLHSNYGCLMAIQTINYLNGQDIETYAKNRFEETELGSMDIFAGHRNQQPGLVPGLRRHPPPLCGGERRHPHPVLCGVQQPECQFLPG